MLISLLYRLFENPVHPHDDILQNCITNFIMEIDKCVRLGSSGRQLILGMIASVLFLAIVNSCTLVILVPITFLLVGKNHKSQKNTHGVRVLFPIEVSSLYIKWMSEGHFQDNNGVIIKKDTTFMEMIRFKVKKENF